MVRKNRLVFEPFGKKKEIIKPPWSMVSSGLLIYYVSNEIIYKNIPFPFNSTRIQKTPVRVQTIIFLWFI